jgi:hypothetical protein
MPGDYRERLKEAEMWVIRARTSQEREAFETIVAIWRRLVEQQTSPPDRPSGPETP